MKNSRLTKQILLTLMMIFSAPSYSSAETINPKMSVVTELDQKEPFAAQAFDGQTLWVGRNRVDYFAAYSLEAYRSDGTLISKVGFPHTLRRIYPLGNNSVLVVGEQGTSELVSGYSIVKLIGETFYITSANQFSENVAIHYYAGEYNKRKIFGAPGGLTPAPEADPKNPGIESLLVETSSSGGFKMFGPKMGMLNDVIIVGETALATEGAIGVNNIVSINLATGATKRMFPGTRLLKTGELSFVGGAALVAVPLRAMNQVLLFDATKNEITKTFSVPAGTPIVAKRLGRCLVVGSQFEHKVTFLDFESGEQVAVWNVSGLGKKFHSLRNLNVDVGGKRIFMRSASPLEFGAHPDPEGRNSVALAYEESGKTFDSCLKN